MIHGHRTVSAQPMAKMSARTAKERIIQVLQLAGEAAEIIVRLRDKPRLLDWAAIAVRILDLGTRAHSVLTHKEQIHPKHALISEGCWVSLLDGFRPFFREIVTDAKLHMDHPDATSWTGRIGGHRVAWIGGKDESERQIAEAYAHVEDYEKVAEELRTAVWSRFPSGRIAFDSGELIEHDWSLETEYETYSLETLSERIHAFHKADKQRAYLVVGVPGCGKSTAAQIVAERLELRTLYVHATHFASLWNVAPGSSPQGELDENHIRSTVLIATIKPDVFILDDIHVLGPYMMNALLHALETIRKHATITIATANSRTIKRAARRPGRVDDILEVRAGMPPSALRVMLPSEDHDLIPRFEEWPISFIRDYLERVDALGRDQARQELDELEQRIAEVSEPEPDPMMGQLLQMAADRM